MRVLLFGSVFDLQAPRGQCHPIALWSGPAAVARQVTLTLQQGLQPWPQALGGGVSSSEWIFFSLVHKAVSSLLTPATVRPHRWQPTRLPGPRDSPGKNTGVGCHTLLQGIFPT